MLVDVDKLKIVSIPPDLWLTGGMRPPPTLPGAFWTWPLCTSPSFCLGFPLSISLPERLLVVLPTGPASWADDPCSLQKVPVSLASVSAVAVWKLFIILSLTLSFVNDV